MAQSSGLPGPLTRATSCLLHATPVYLEAPRSFRKILLPIQPLMATHLPVAPYCSWNNSQPVPSGVIRLPLPPAPATLHSSLCVQHLNRAPTSGPLHLCDCSLNILLSDLSDPPLPLLNKTKLSSPPMLLPRMGAGAGGLFCGFGFCWACALFGCACGSASLTPRGAQSSLFSDFSAGTETVWRTVPVAMRTALVSPTGRASPFAARASVSLLLSPLLHPAPGSGPTRPLLVPLHREPLPLPSMRYSLKLSY